MEKVRHCLPNSPLAGLTTFFSCVRLSRNKDEVKALSEKGQVITTPKDAIKDPYILEFLGLKEDKNYSESDLEQALDRARDH